MALRRIHADSFIALIVICVMIVAPALMSFTSAASHQHGHQNQSEPPALIADSHQMQPVGHAPDGHGHHDLMLVEDDVANTATSERPGGGCNPALCYSAVGMGPLGGTSLQHFVKIERSVNPSAKQAAPFLAPEDKPPQPI